MFEELLEKYVEWRTACNQSDLDELGDYPDKPEYRVQLKAEEQAAEPPSCRTSRS